MTAIAECIHKQCINNHEHDQILRNYISINFQSYSTNFEYSENKKKRKLIILVEYKHDILHLPVQRPIVRSVAWWMMNVFPFQSSLNSLKTLFQDNATLLGDLLLLALTAVT